MSTQRSIPAQRWPTRLRRAPLSVLAVAMLAGWTSNGQDETWLDTAEDAKFHAAAPVDRGAGPGKKAGKRRAVTNAGVAARSLPADANAHLTGTFGSAFEWPIIPIHAVLLADGRVLSYGTDILGVQSGLMHYALWDPALGTGPEAMQVLDNVTGTDTFCAGQALLPGTGDVLLVGGDRTVGNQRNFGVNDVNIFTPTDNQLARQSVGMAYQRWYATVVTNGLGEQVVLGGRIDKSMPNADPPIKASFAAMPEVYSRSTGWRTLGNAGSEAAYGKSTDNWSYPHAWLAPDGTIAILGNDGRLFSLDTRNIGKVKRLVGTLPSSKQFNSAAMFEPGRILSLRTGGLATVVDLNTAPPTITPTAAMSQNRFYGSATVLADGKVWANGGSVKGNKLEGAAYHSELWDPATGSWSLTATAAKPRLYHSISMLMPDGTVLTGGGGAPGPVINLNAEVYYPPYLYKTDGSGEAAERPVITSAPAAGTWGQVVPVTMGSVNPVARVSLVRFGAVTHAFSNDQRYQSLPFTQTDDSLSVALPASPNIAPPGFYMLFVLDSAGVPSVAKVLRLD